MVQIDKLSVIALGHWVTEIICLHYMNGLARELLLKGKALYNWPPCINLCRSATFYTDTIIFIFYKTTYLNEEVNCTEPLPTKAYKAYFNVRQSVVTTYMELLFAQNKQV
jgi:hypothetical protein